MTGRPEFADPTTLWTYGRIGADAGGTVHVVYYDIPNHQLRHAFRAPGGPWTFRVIDTAPTDSFRHTALTTDRAGGVHVTYQQDFGLINRRDLKYVFLPAGGIWTAPLIIDSGGQAGFGSAIHVDNGGGVHVSTVRYRGGIDERARYLYRPPGGTWQQAEDVGAAYARKTSLLRESNGIIHVTYTSRQGLMYRRRLAMGNWEPEVVAVANSVSQPTNQALVSDSRAHLHALHLSAAGRALYDVERSPGTPPTGGQWSNLVLVDGQRTAVGLFTTAAVDSSGRIHVAYHDSTNEDLKYAQRSSLGVWGQPVVVDGAGQIANYGASLVHAGGRVHISYYDWSNGDLKYAVGCP